MRAKEFRALVSSLARAGEPAEPRCPHAGECGGCAFQDRTYVAQLAAKAEALTRLFSQSGLAAELAAGGLEVVASPDPYSYRTRMDYVATKGRFGLRARGKFNYIVELTTCHLVPPAAFAAAQAVWQAAMALGLPDYNLRNHSGFLRYVVVRRSPADQFLLAAVTAAGPYDAEMEQLAITALNQSGVIGFHWLLNPGLTDLSFGTPVRHWGAALLPMHVGNLDLVIGPNTFFQNNLHLLERLLADLQTAVLAVADSTPVADLYSGVGAIGLHLAPAVSAVVCVESVGESATLAAQNAAAAGCTNLQVLTGAVLPFLREQPDRAFGVVVADPPRTGLGPEVCAELLRLAPHRIVYLSCNPLTQFEDLHALAPGYRLQSLRGYDMFPQTPHLETLAILDQHQQESSKKA